jgi:predicted metal-dependent peptidase
VTLVQHKVAAARVWATARMPYLAHAVFAARVREVEGTGTIAVDETWTVTADPEVLGGVDAVELGKLLLHLVSHALRDHAPRAEAVGAEERGWWNRCGDAEINDDLQPVGAVPLSAPDLPADLGCPDHGLAEAYYGAPQTGPRPWDCGSGADGVPRDWEGDGSGLSRAQQELLRNRTAADVQEAHQRDPGSVPEGLVRWAETLRNPRVDWRRVLAAEIRRAVASVSGNVDYTYRRPSRRGAAARPAVLPSLHRPLPLVAVVCDTSGSMHDELLTRALAEIDALLNRAGLRSAQLRVLAVDTQVHAVSTVSTARDVRLVGGGGTDMGEGIAAALRLRPRPSLVVVLTDGFTPWPEHPPPVRVVVGLLAQSGAPAPEAPEWARTVVVDADV